MSTFVPDPNLVVEALRFYAGQFAGVDTARLVLPHAEAIAEMWDWTMPQAAAVQELIAAARDEVLTNSGGTRLRAALNAVLA